MEPRVIQVGNYLDDSGRKFDNPQCGRVYSVEGLSPTINTCQGGQREPKILLEMEERRYKAKRIQSLVDSGKIDPEKVQFLDCYNQSVSDDVTGTIHTRIDGANHYFVTEPTSCASRKRGDEHKIETRKDGLANCVTSIDTDSMVQEPLKIPQATKQGYIECPVGGVFDASYPDSDKRRGRVQENGEVSPALTTNSEGAILRYEGVEPNPLLQKGAVIANTQLNCYRGTIEEPAPTVCAAAGMGGGHVAMVVENVEPQVLTPLRTEEGRQLRKQGIEKFSNRALYPREDGVSNTITSVQKDNLLQEPTLKAAKELKEIAQNGRNCEVDVTVNPDGSLRPYNSSTKAKDGISEFVTQHEDNSANTVTTSHGGNVYGKSTRYRIRKLTEREVLRLMSVNEQDIDKIMSCGVSKTAIYRMAGNSIVTDCLYWIFYKMFINPKCEDQQLSLFDFY